MLQVGMGSVILKLPENIKIYKQWKTTVPWFELFRFLWLHFSIATTDAIRLRVAFSKSIISVAGFP